MLNALPGNDRNQKGTWRIANIDGTMQVVLVCPECGANGPLTGKDSEHEIEQNGTVVPSVVCDCGFHDQVRLLSWEGSSG